MLRAPTILLMILCRAMIYYWIALKNSVPELIATSLLVVLGIEIQPAIFLCCLCFSGFLLRVLWNSALIIHGLGHALLTAIFDQDPSFFRASNILENRSLSSILKSCIPFAPIFLPGFHDISYPWVAVGNPTPWRIRAKALGGILFNAIASLTALFILSLEISNIYTIADITTLLLITFAGANLFAIASSLSDFAAIVTGQATCFNCGNFGFLGERLPQDKDELLPARVVDIFRMMGSETEIRGEQAGGGVTFAKDSHNQVVFVGEKVVNIKRKNLTQSLEAAFLPVRKKATAVGAKPLDKAIMGVWHYRYATSSPPAVMETHWHEWTPAREAEVWRVDQGQWVCDHKRVNHRITHNGDFDAWTLFGKAIPNAPLGLWLERVLHTPNSTQGDSPKIAGLMDLLITQGMWDASLRLAYQMAIADSIEAAFDGEVPAKRAPNTAPSEQLIQAWTAIAKPIFLKHKGTLLRPYAKSMLEHSKKHLARFEQALSQALSADSTISQWSPSKQSTFVKNAVYAFFHNNLYQATKLFMSRAEGSFGLVTASTLSEDSLVLSSWGQPIATGFNVQENYMVYASEPAAVDAVLSSIPRSYRLDLDQKWGEIAWVGVDNIAVYSMREDRELRGAELEQRWIPLQENPYILPPKANAKDPIEQDIKDIAGVLTNIDISWRDPDSFNRQSGEYLAELLLDKAKVWEQKQRATINIKLASVSYEQPLDLLITGVESSLWLGEQFAQDLSTLFPALSIKTISSNQVLRKLHDGFSGLHLDKTSIVLAISHSGQTFPTLQATNAFEVLRQQGGIGELFIMTGEICSLMGSAIAQYYYPESSFTRRIFVNGSGRRTAEPITVVVAATQSTLTELLFYLAGRLRQRFPARQGPFGMTLSADDLSVLERMKDDFLKQRVAAITGTAANGESLPSLEHQRLVDSSRKWALHIIETPTTWAIHALYILITVGFGVPLLQTVFRGIAAIANLPEPWLRLLPLFTLGDILIYIFGPWLWALALRYFQGRPLVARTGNRSLVIGDVRWVHKLLKAYVSKLFSLSYGIASVDVHSANPQDHMLHHYGHRVVRGTLVFLGIPDGRRHPMRRDDESAVIMTGKQAIGVQNVRAGAEIIALGHNPKIAQQGFQDAIVLSSNLASNLDASAPNNTLTSPSKVALEKLQESRFSAYERLLASYVFFWALARRVSSFPLLRYQHWKSQSRTRITTTAAPVARSSN